MVETTLSVHNAVYMPWKDSSGHQHCRLFHNTRRFLLPKTGFTQYLQEIPLFAKILLSSLLWVSLLPAKSEKEKCESLRLQDLEGDLFLSSAME